MHLALPSSTLAFFFFFELAMLRATFQSSRTVLPLLTDFFFSHRGILSKKKTLRSAEAFSQLHSFDGLLRCFDGMRDVSDNRAIGTCCFTCVFGIFAHDISVFLHRGGHTRNVQKLRRTLMSMNRMDPAGAIMDRLDPVLV